MSQSALLRAHLGLSEVHGQTNECAAAMGGAPENPDPSWCKCKPEAAEPYAWSIEYESAGAPVRWLRWKNAIGEFADHHKAHAIPLYAAPVAAQRLEHWQDRRRGERRIRNETVSDGLRRRGDRRYPVAAQPDALAEEARLHSAELTDAFGHIVKTLPIDLYDRIITSLRERGGK